MTTTNPDQPDVEGSTRPDGTPRLVYPAMLVPFVLLVTCFAAWGSAANLTDVLVGVFRKIFTGMSNFESGLVQFAYYGAYFTLAIPAAFINKRFGYKTGVLTGLGLAAVGGLLFIPASRLLTYSLFLAALFVLAAGLSILETSANPFAIAMGPEESATRRLNLAQSFNPVGANIGVLLGAALILPNLTAEEDKVGLSPEQLVATQERDLGLVLGPYVGIALVLILIWLLIFFRKGMHSPVEDVEVAPGAQGSAGVLGRLFRNAHYRWGVVAQFFNVGAQTCTWSFTIQYAEEIVGWSPGAAGWALQASLLLFLFSRFLMFYLLGRIRPTKLLLVMAVLGVVFALVGVVSPNIVGLLCVIGISLSLSLMFPTIYGVALQGLGGDTKFGAAGLVMAILGGALLTPAMGALADVSNFAVAFLIPAFALAVVAAYALFDLTTKRHSEALVSEV